MKKTTYILYFICVVSAFFVFLCFCTGVHNDVFQIRKSSAYQFLTADEQNEIYDLESDAMPIGMKTEYIINQLTVPQGGACLMFYSIHQGVEVYIDNELVYRLKAAEDNLFGKTPGNHWNTIPVYPGDMGKQLKIVLIPAYQSSADFVPDFYFGSETDIRSNIIREDVLPFTLALIAIISGIVFLLFVAFTYRKAGADKSLIMMGMFSILLGLWKMADIKSTALLLPYFVARSYATFLCLLLIAVPYVLYIKQFFTKRRWVWYIPYTASIIVIAASLLLQVTNILDLRQTMWMNLAVMGMVLVTALAMLVQELYYEGWSKRLMLVGFCMLCCLIGMPLDVGSYYFFYGSSVTVMGMTGFLIYIIVLGISSIQDAQKVMALGTQAKAYKQMAYHDQLTGLYNRTAYAKDIGKLESSREQCVLAMFDLNDLKHCNDTWGHDKGDSYIANSAKLIQNIFGDIGKCYRMGGDEFCVVLKEFSIEKCEALIEELQEQTRLWNEQSDEDFTMEIAGGCVQYNPETDYDLNDTLRRADKMMYRKKLHMKTRRKQID